MVVHIKNMVCNRCILVVEQELTKLGFHLDQVLLGEVHLKDNLNDTQLHALDHALQAVGFERIDDRKGRLIEALKSKIIQTIRDPKGTHHANWSKILSDELHYEYNYISSLFSSVEGITLEQYIIRQKIERAKELLFYDELTLSQIADALGYSNVAHLSAQFKKIAGLTPSQLKKNRNASDRNALDEIG
jgi:YesN/AraC family two-component response regulator